MKDRSNANESGTASDADFAAGDDLNGGTRPLQYASDRFKREQSPHPNETAHSTLPPLQSIIDEKYRIDAELGRGGMGAVYQARHITLGKPVALKWLLPEFANDHDSRQRFLREARAAGNIKHENVVDVYDFGIDRERGVPYIVMELLMGMPLSAYLAQRVRLDAREAVDIMLQCMRGVAAAHKLGIVHRDLKPENIFLCEGDEPGSHRVKVLDFGVAAALEPKSDDSTKHIITQTASRNVVGTVFYMSAEQLAGGVVDARADVYASGVICYELLAGQTPYTGHSYNDLATAILDGHARPLTEVVPGIDPTLSELVQRAMAPRMADRFPSMNEAIGAFQQYRKQLRSLSVREAAAPLLSQSRELSPPSPARVDKRLWGIAALAVVVLAALLAWGLSRTPEASTPEPHQVRPKPPEQMQERAEPSNDVVLRPSAEGAAETHLPAETPAGAEAVPASERTPEAAQNAARERTQAQPETAARERTAPEKPKTAGAKAKPAVETTRKQAAPAQDDKPVAQPNPTPPRRPNATPQPPSSPKEPKKPVYETW